MEEEEETAMQGTSQSPQVPPVAQESLQHLNKAKGCGAKDQQGQQRRKRSKPGNDREGQGQEKEPDYLMKTSQGQTADSPLRKKKLLKKEFTKALLS